MRVDEREHQAAAFCEMYRRAPSGDWRCTFSQWGDTKDFVDRDLCAIEAIVQDMFYADGTLTFT